MEKEELIRILESNFINRWKDLGGNESENIAKRLDEYFLVDSMLTVINERIYNENSYRYQVVILRSLSKRFAMILFLTSNRGNEINNASILEAQRLLKIDSVCKIYPCTKLFG